MTQLWAKAWVHNMLLHLLSPGLPSPAAHWPVVFGLNIAGQEKEAGGKKSGNSFLFRIEGWVL